MLKESEIKNEVFCLEKLEEVMPIEVPVEKKKNNFHKTKLLLSIYRTVVWRIENSIVGIQETAEEYGGKRISDLIDFLCIELVDFDFNKDKKEVEERLTSIAETKLIIDIIDKALLHLKSHPDNGEIYHDIIKYCYIDKEKVCDSAIMIKLNLTQSTYYRYKKQAIEVMGVALWGYIIAPLEDYWNNIK